MFPFASVAVTENVWLPVDRPLTATAEVQVEYAAPSSEHWKVAPASPVKLSEAEELLVIAAGPATVGASGGVRSYAGV